MEQPKLVIMEGEKKMDNEALDRENRIDDFIYNYDEYDLSGDLSNDEFQLIKNLLMQNGYTVHDRDDIELLGGRIGDWIRSIVQRIRERRAERARARLERYAQSGAITPQPVDTSYPFQGQQWNVSSPYGTATLGPGGFSLSQPGQMRPGQYPQSQTGIIQQMQNNPLLILTIAGFGLILLMNLKKR